MSISVGSERQIPEYATQSAVDGVTQWAVGASLLHSPDTTCPHLAPELFDGVTTEAEGATVLVVASSGLMINGLSQVVLAASEELGVNTASLRSSEMAARLKGLAGSEFEAFYDRLTLQSGPEAAVIAQGLRMVRVNPFSNPGFLHKFLHSRRGVLAEELVAPLPVPYWVRASGLLTLTMGELGVFIKRYHTTAGV